MNQELAFETALALYESDDHYPVDFEVAWQWLGYSKKGNAKRFLVKNFAENEDYRVLKIEESAPGGGLTHREDIYLTVNCLKEMGMMVGTAKGKEVRNYFLQCEAIAKQATKIIPQLQQQIQELQQGFAQLQTLLPPSADFIPPGWDAKVWEQLPPQDKRHFRFIYKRYGFQPESQTDTPLLPPADIREQQRQEVERIIGEVSHEEMWRIEDAKQELLARFWEQESES